MGLFGKLFGGNKTEKQQEQAVALNNDKLCRLLDKFGREESEHSFKLVLHELFEGNSFLLIPTTKDEDQKLGELRAIQKGEQLQLTSIVEQEGANVWMIFSDEDSLRKSTDKEVYYMLLKTQDVFVVGREMKIDKIVINGGLENMFVLEHRDEEHIDEEEIEKESEVKITIPATPLSADATDNLLRNFADLAFVEEMYQFVQEEATEQGESQLVLMIGVCLSDDTDDNRATMLDTIKQSLKGQKKPALPLGIMVLDEEWLQTMLKAGIRPFYKK